MPLSLADLIIFIAFLIFVFFGFRLANKKFRNGGLKFIMIIILLFIIGNIVEHFFS